MKTELLLKQKQKLILTPQLYQSINILQLNLVELKILIDKELVENPLLEINQEASSMVEKISQEENSNSRIEEPERSIEGDNFFDWLSYLKEKNYQTYSLPGSRLERDNSYENFIYYKESLHEYLLAQLGLVINNNTDCKIGEYLIGNIDDNGYLTFSLDDISGDLNIKRDKIEKILSLIQSFDPPGVGARNLEECLLIQAKYLGLNDVNIETIIKKHLNDLARKAYKKIAKDLKISVFEVQSLADIIKRTLDPKPGREIGDLEEVKYIIPDLTVMKRGEDEYRVFLNDTYLPQIRINSQYQKILDVNNNSSSIVAERLTKRKNISDHEIKDTIKYIEGKLDSAKSLLKGIEHRKRTVYQIAEIIVNYQKDFLDEGILYIKPLTLKEVADRLNIHESTVCRAISNKIIQTPRGFLKMNFFFSKGVDMKSGGIVSTDKVKSIIKEYIDNEDHLKPWSDQKLTELLSKKKGINISRRTVTKYREILKISPSNLRKRFEI